MTAQSWGHSHGYSCPEASTNDRDDLPLSVVVRVESAPNADSARLIFVRPTGAGARSLSGYAARLILLPEARSYWLVAWQLLTGRTMAEGWLGSW